jgi:hypothetical protein
VFFVITAVAVSAVSALGVGRFSRHEAGVRAQVAPSESVRGVAAGVAKAAVRMLVCRLKS